MEQQLAASEQERNEAVMKVTRRGLSRLVSSHVKEEATEDVKDEVGEKKVELFIPV